MSLATLQGQSLDFAVKHSLDDLLKNPVRFRPAVVSSPSVPEGTYTVLNNPKQSTVSRKSFSAPTSPTRNKRSGSSSQEYKKSSGTRGDGANDFVDEDPAFIPPARILFPEEKLSMEWDNIMPNAPGLVNLGNTCFMNSVLQLMTQTPPLVQYLLSGQHSLSCRMNACVLCRMEQHVARAYPNKGTKRASAFKPSGIQSMLKVISSHFRPYRQEDAHEFMRYLVDAWQKSCLQNHKNLDHPSRETSVVHRIFGGYLRQQILCSVCKKPSNTYQALLDLSVDAKGSSLADSLKHFVHAEKLTKQNKYRCENCKQLVDASKQMTIYRAPNILTIHFKRFTFNGFQSSKISKQISYPESFNLGPYMSDPNCSCWYELIGVLVHAGGSTRSGHYYSFCKSSNGVWLKFDDDFVSNSSIDRVLNQQAYILQYKRKSTSSSKHKLNTENTVTKTSNKKRRKISF
ncbi:ubiquitin C-terminal hydrolase Ubp16 [Schizosaccharomyces pombe]|uniref:Probable ubiquitin carboxyl-terminal hydrolase 16 n=1 Tax=Schizosaccharomyces pombe (strain 972 / ATCC 24843) TaxID=284812 RepID=UBP16_SCHPO|nr:ubiquitin hydrolase Ubp16 [Schizosaccharomyces pombe]O74442.1 RecName: Full=Probable ubiquitin carboxyl-terminal hydrolase 16; AltName: Full=Deubiquitinating enzyme 16; AltName: Full=Ubiquitin thioesterase 16; AltName: Full=Ubiquitin-specific-processing protease 16 [Schizosaccharomyces pombe 972h-]CAA20678.1 ubiquitin C-terminal hydrolase Ubp16 [Schizosaccharomyces pombe]|eukprot:NP_587805.1 ubiquitin hydrolase Ubp16 [Schizosaccharomyces pombe]